MKQSGRHVRTQGSVSLSAAGGAGGGKQYLAVRILCVVMTGFVSLACLGGAVALGMLRGLLGNIEIVDPNTNSAVVIPPEHIVDQPDPDYGGDTDLSHLSVRGNTASITNILLVGVDNRTDDDYGRSDTNMILSINHKTKTIRLISLMRDTWVQIPGVDYNGDGTDDYTKLNAAYSSGGFPVLQSTIKKNFCLDIPQFAMVDFEAFRVGVDALGGMDIELTATEASWIPKLDPGNPDSFAKNFDGQQVLEPVGTEAGTYHLQGFQVLAYCRLRYIYADSDYSRQENQRIVVGKLLDQIKQSSPATLLTMLSQVFDYVQTNIPRDEIEGKYIIKVFDYLDYTIETEYHVPSASEFSILVLSGMEGLWIDDPTAAVSSLHQYIYG